MNPSVVSGVVITALIHGSVLAGLFAFTGWGRADAEPALQMVTIEAALAYKSKDKDSKQPQKKKRAAKKRSEVKPTGVSRDEQKKPEPQKKPDEPDEDFADDVAKFMQMRQSQADDDEGVDVDSEAETHSGGQFDGSEHGFAEVSRGDPYMQELAAQVFAAWAVPTLERGEGMAVGCVRLAADGSVVDTNLWKSAQNANIDRSVKLALDSLKKSRKPGDAPVPGHLKDATLQWTCFNFPVTAK